MNIIESHRNLFMLKEETNCFELDTPITHNYRNMDTGIWKTILSFRIVIINQWITTIFNYFLE